MLWDMILRELQPQPFTPFSNTCKTQLYFVKMLRKKKTKKLGFCEKLSWKRS